MSFETKTSSGIGRPVTKGDQLRIALASAAVGFFLLVIIAAVAWIGWEPIQKLLPFSDVNPALSTLFPLLGVWFGMIVAFYFLRDNFRSDTTYVAPTIEQTKDALERMLRDSSYRFRTIEGLARAIGDKTEGHEVTLLLLRQIGAHPSIGENGGAFWTKDDPGSKPREGSAAPKRGN